MLVNLFDLTKEFVEFDLPVSFVSLREDILVVDLQLFDLLLHFLDQIINL